MDTLYYRDGTLEVRVTGPWHSVSVAPEFKELVHVDKDSHQSPDFAWQIKNWEQDARPDDRIALISEEQYQQLLSAISEISERSAP